VLGALGSTRGWHASEPDVKKYGFVPTLKNVGTQRHRYRLDGYSKLNGGTLRDVGTARGERGPGAYGLLPRAV